MRFSSLTRAADRTAAACSLKTQAGAPAGQAAPSAVQRSPPSVTHIMGYYSFNRPRRDGRPCWLTDSGRRTHKVVKQPSISLAQDKESPPARTDVLTTMPLWYRGVVWCACRKVSAITWTCSCWRCWYWSVHCSVCRGSSRRLYARWLTCAVSLSCRTSARPENVQRCSASGQSALWLCVFVGYMHWLAGPKSV